MNKLLLLLLIAASVTSNGQSRKTDPAHASKMAGREETTLLFKQVKTRLTEAEKKQLFRLLGLSLSADKKELLSGELPVAAEVFPVDLNSDGTEEVFVILNSTALFGNAGSGFYLFTKTKGSAYQRQQDIGGARPVILYAKSYGYAGIVGGGPGMEHPVFRWNNGKYHQFKLLKDADLAKTRSMDIETFSKTYTDKL